MGNRDFNRTVDAKIASDEQRFANREAFEFKVAARRNRLLAGWLGERLGLDPERTGKYVRELISADLTEAGSEDVIAKVMADIAAAGAAVAEDDVRRAMGRLEAEARDQLEREA